MVNDEIETFQGLEDDVKLAVHELEERAVPVTINGVYEALGKRYDIRTIREFMWYLYPDTPEAMIE